MMPNGKRRNRYRRWLDKCYDYLHDTGDVRTAQWLLENIGYKANGERMKNSIPPNVGSAAQKLSRDGRFHCFENEGIAYGRTGHPYSAHAWGVMY
jgi:hypothetical protein